MKRSVGNDEQTFALFDQLKYIEGVLKHEYARNKNSARIQAGGVSLLIIPDASCTINWLFLGAADPPCIAAANANGDTAVNIADASFILSVLFTGESPVTCQEAADANDDATINIADGIFVLNALFGGGQPPPAPYPDCGVGTMDDALTCDAFAACP